VINTKFCAKPISLEVGGKPVVILNRQDADAMGLHALDRVMLKSDGKELVAIVDITTKFAKLGEVLTSDGVTSFFSLKAGDEIFVKPGKESESVTFIKQKIAGNRLEKEKIRTIIKDVVERRLSDIELSAFVTTLKTRGMSMDEIEHMSRAMVETGKKLKFNRITVDKHSIGGICGDKTSLVLVPTVAAAGLTIPKTSSRAITSPAGTADRMEVLAPVNFTVGEIEKIVNKTNGCLVWGGALELAPADDIFIQIEYPLGIDPLMLTSIMSKKKAVGAQYLVIDIPTGRGAKIKTIGEAHELAEDFLELGKRLGIKVSCCVTFGEQPLGYAMGPALEAREALLTLQGKGPADLKEKVLNLAGTLFQMVGLESKLAKEILESGKAEKKMREIIAAQGGNEKIKTGDISVGDEKAEIKSEKDGKVLWIKNAEMVTIAREAGAPRDKGAGILLNKKIGYPVRKGENLFTIFAENSNKLENAVKLAEISEPIGVGKEIGERMLLDRIPTKIPHRRVFMLER
jgi:AMP phosphorylase